MSDHIQAVQAAKLFLSWGADFIDDPHSMGSKDCCIVRAQSQAQANRALVSILESNFCGRRYELVDLSSQSGLNGRTCIVDEYLKASDQYKVTVEGRKKEVLIVSPENLKRRDRTPKDCGYFIEFKKGRFICYDFDTKDEYQAFSSAQSSDEQPAVDPDAEVKAEKAAADLLAELGLDDVTEKKTKQAQSNGKKSKSKKKGKKGKK